MSAGDQRIFNSSAMLLADSASIPRVLGCTTGGDLYTFAHRTLTRQNDLTLNDIDKTFTVPAGRLWWLHQMNITLIASVTVGNRLMRLDVSGSDTNPVWRGVAGVVLTASQTGLYSYFPGAPRDAAFNSLQASVPIPTHLLLPAGDLIRFREINAIDAAADDMFIQIVYDEITV